MYLISFLLQINDSIFQRGDTIFKGDEVLYIITPNGIEEPSELSTIQGVLAFIIPSIVLGVILYYQRSKFRLKKVQNGVFRQNLPLNRDSLFEAYLCLAAVMIQKERQDAGKKHLYIKKFLLTYFNDSYYNFSETISGYYKSEPIQPSSVAEWINKYVTDYGKRTQVVYFLAGISMVDGEIVAIEMAFLKEITRLLHIKEEDLESILNTFSYYDFKKKQKHTTNGQSFTSSILDSAFKMLNLNNGATIDEVKSAYRKLAKIHHPDLFSTENEGQQKIAHERFVQINEAYELVLKSF